MEAGQQALSGLLEDDARTPSISASGGRGTRDSKAGFPRRHEPLSIGSKSLAFTRHYFQALRRVPAPFPDTGAAESRG
jgi:hypothetical protein